MEVDASFQDPEIGGIVVGIVIEYKECFPSVSPSESPTRLSNDT